MVSIEQARSIALSLPQAEERTHQGHPDFRVGGRIFATLRPRENRAALRLGAFDLETLLASNPRAFARNSWSRQGWIDVALAEVEPEELGEAVEAAWRLVAPARLAARHAAEKRNR